eukprot:1968226-Pleurochrysis_carterae.AAC.1
MTSSSLSARCSSGEPERYDLPRVRAERSGQSESKERMRVGRARHDCGSRAQRLAPPSRSIPLHGSLVSPPPRWRCDGRQRPRRSPPAAALPPPPTAHDTPRPRMRTAGRSSRSAGALGAQARACVHACMRACVHACMRAC